MRKTIVAATTAALIAGGITAEAAKHHANPALKCAAPRGETLVADADTRVYTQGLKSTSETDRFAIYSCRYASGKRFLLGTVIDPHDDAVPNTPSRFIRDFRLTGDFGGTPGPGVAYVVGDCKSAVCQTRIIVRSTRSGKIKMNLKGGSPFDRVALSQGDTAFELGWLETSPGGDCGEGCRVHLVTNKGDRLLAEGQDIDPFFFGLVDTQSRGIVGVAGGDVLIYKVGNAVQSELFGAR